MAAATTQRCVHAPDGEFVNGDGFPDASYEYERAVDGMACMINGLQNNAIGQKVDLWWKYYIERWSLEYKKL